MLKVKNTIAIDNNFITSFGDNTICQVSGYLNTLHGLLSSNASLVLSFGKDCSFGRSGSVETIKKNF